jgi:hypothetical protein
VARCAGPAIERECGWTVAANAQDVMKIKATINATAYGFRTERTPLSIGSTVRHAATARAPRVVQGGQADYPMTFRHSDSSIA